MATQPAQYAAKTDLTSGRLSWNLFRLAAPMAAHSFLHGFYSLADAFWLGHWSKTALAAQAVCWPFFMLVWALAISFGTSATALISQLTGAGRHRDSERASGQTMMLLTVMALFLVVPILLFSRPLLRLVQVPGEAVEQANIYLHISMLAFPVIGFNVAYAATLRARGNAVTVLLIGLAGNLVNIALDPLLIFGVGFLPTLGTGGAASASLVARVVEALVCYAFLRRGHSGLNIALSDLMPNWRMLRKMFAVALPLTVHRSSDSIGFMVFQTMINTLGTTVIGAVTVGFRITHFFNLPAHAMSLAAAPVVGQALGAGKKDLARRAVRFSAVLVAVVMFVPLLVLVGYGKSIARLFIQDPAVVAEAGKFFLVVPASSYFFGVLMVLLAAYFGSGHTMPAMVVGIIRLWVLRVPLAYLLAFIFDWGSMGIYVAMVVGNVCCALLALGLFLRGGWASAVVEQIESEEEGEAASADEQQAASTE